MTDFCSMCMKPAVYKGSIWRKDNDMEVFAGAYCEEHMIIRMGQITDYLKNSRRIKLEKIRGIAPA